MGSWTLELRFTGFWTLYGILEGKLDLESDLFPWFSKVIEKNAFFALLFQFQ